VARRKRANPHETQAKFSLWLAAIGGLSCLALMVLAFRRFEWGEFAVQYREGSWRYYAIFGAAFVSAAASAIGFFIALNSAGQKRNELSGLAWKTFFVNAVVLTLTLCVLVLFWFARDPVYRSPG
jgi:hypothetical protein